MKLSFLQLKGGDGDGGWFVLSHSFASVNDC